jgi:phosphatidylcholine synthase
MDLSLEDSSPRSTKKIRRRIRKFLAWCVHGYTALGLVAAAGIVVAVFDHSFRLAFILMFIATLIDATDGTLARLVRVKEVLPGFDGRRLDDLIDFQTYTALPLLLIWQAGIVSPENSWCLVIPLLASAYGFCQTSVKTDDGFFLGFPSYWNLVAFYLYALQPVPEEVSLGLLFFLAFLTFVPSRYLYPTQRGPLSRTTNGLGAAWAVLLFWIVWLMPEKGLPAGTSGDNGLRLLALLSLVFPAYYLSASWALSVGYWRKKRRGRAHKKGFNLSS